MAGIGDILRMIGRGAQTGLGAALTPPAMILAARAGRSPFSALPGYQEPLNALQQAQLQQTLQRGQLIESQNALLRNALEQAGLGGTLPASPEQVDVPAFSDQGVMQAQPVSTGAAAEPRTLAAPQAGGGARLTGLNVGGMQFSVPGSKVRQVESGTINPNTGKPYKAGELLPSGESALVKPSKAGQTLRDQVGRVRSAISVFNSIYNTKFDPTTGKPSETGVFATEVLPSGKSYGGATAVARAVLPREIFGLGTRTRAAYGNALAQKIESGEGTVVSFVKAFGDAANIAEKEQDRALQAFLPNTGDTREVGELKRQFTPQILANLAATLEANPDATPEQAWTYVLEAAATVNNAIQGGDQTSQAPTQGPAPGPSPASGQFQSARDRFRAAIGGSAPRTLKRATGGDVPPGRTALVGEQGPELVQGPAFVKPLAPQQDAANLLKRKAEPRRLAQAVATSPDQARGAAYTGFKPQATTTTLPPGSGGLGQGVGLTPAQVQQVQGGGTRIVQRPDGSFAVVPAGQ